MPTLRGTNGIATKTVVTEQTALDTGLTGVERAESAEAVAADAENRKGAEAIEISPAVVKTRSAKPGKPLKP